MNERKTISYNNIEKLLPLLSYDEDILVSKMGDMTVLYEIYLPEVFSCGRSDYDNLHKTWVRALNSLPDNTIIHKQDCFIESHYHNYDEKRANTFLSRASNAHFEGRRYLDHRCFVYITICPKNNFHTKVSHSPLDVKGFFPSDKEDVSKRDFESLVASFFSILNENGIESRRLTQDEIIGSEKKFGIIENYINLDYSAKSVLSDISIYNDFFKIGDKYVSMFSIDDTDELPQSVSTYIRHNSFSSDNIFFAVDYTHSISLPLNFSHIYNQYFFIENQQEVLKKVEVNMSHQRAFSAVSRENAVNMAFNSNYLDDISLNSRRPVRCAFNLICWDANYPLLLKKNVAITSRLANMDITASHRLQVTPQMFWGGIPGAASIYPYEMTFLTALEQGCCFINNETNYRTSKSGFGIRLCDRLSGKPINVDISDEPLLNKHWIDNRNKFILGPSGSGKSFFTNHMVRQYYEQDTHVVIVDVGDSYLGLCKQINQETEGKDGIYYTYKEDNPIRFNPFYVEDRIYTTEKREQLSNLIFVLWKGDHDYSKTEETHVSTAINDYINKKVVGEGIFPCFNSFYEFLCNDMKQYVKEQNIRLKNFDIDDLIQVLRPYYKGGNYDYLLNATENLNLLDKRFIVFEIDNIKDHPTLFPVVTLVLMDTFLSKMRHSSIANQRKMILIEEAWKAISKKGTAEFIKYLYKTVRKHFGEAIVVTQEVDDIISNPIVKETIISNADCKILLDQRKYQNKFSIIQNVLALSEKEVTIALSMNKDIKKQPGRLPYKEVFISLNGNHSATYAVEVSREEYLTYTTEKREKEHLYALEEQTGSMEKAIKQYIKEEKL